MTVDSIKNGFVIDHIKPGNGMKIYRILSDDKNASKNGHGRNLPQHSKDHI